MKKKNNQRTVSGTVSNDRCDLCGPDHRICPDQFPDRFSFVSQKH